MKIRKLFVAVMAIAVMGAPFAQAADGTWTLNNAGNWSTTNNWLGGIVADGADFTATLGDVITADRTITLDSVRAIGGITVSDASHNYTITSSKLTLDVTSGSPTLTVPSGRTLTISSVIAGSDGLTKIGTGTLTLSSSPNQFTGSTIISDGKVALGAQYALWQSAYDTTGSTGAIGLDRSAQATPWLGGLAGSVDVATAITGYSGITSLILNPQTGYTNTYLGVIANGAANMTLNKSGHGTQTLTGVNTYSGATTVWAGTLGVAGTSGSALNSAFTVKGGTLSLDNSGGTWANRLTDGTAISLGSLTLKSDNGGSPQTETIGATTLATSGKITVDNGTGAGTTLAVNGTVTRAANSGVAIDFVGMGGTLGGGAGNPNVTATTLPSNANGILPWATVNGTLWAENNANSVQAYSGTFVDPTSAASDATKNAQVTGSGTMGSAKSFNSLNVIASGADQSLSLGGILTLTSPGAILKSGSDPYSITSSVANAVTAGAELIAHVDGGALTISAPLNGSIVGIAKGGTGDLILSGTRAGTMSGAISIAGGQLEFRGNSTTLSGVITGVGGLTVNLNPGQTLTVGNNANSYAGQTIVKGGYLTQSAYNSIGLPGGLRRTPLVDNTSLIGSNLKLEGGIFFSMYTFDKDLGEGPNQIQILGGTSGLAQNCASGGASGFTLDNGRELVWGSTYFNPTVFVHSTVGNLILNLANGIDLNGSTRTVLVGDATYNALAGGGSSQLGGVIRTSSGTAGLTKTGVGILLLTGASTFNGAVTISQGTLDFQGNANVASPNPLGQSSAAAANLLLSPGTTLKYTGGAASSDRSFTINGTAAGDSASLNASGSGALVLSNTSTPAYGTSDQTRTLILTGTSAANLTNTLAANLADNGTGALSVTKTGTNTWVLTGASSYTGPTTVRAGLLGVGAANNLGSGGNLIIEGGGLSIRGTTLNNYSELGHTIVFGSHHTTLTLDIADAGNTFTVDQSLPSGGLLLSGAGTAVFQGSVTNLVLNTPTGITATYGGVIADGATGMTVTKTGAGTQILTGNNNYTGTTYLNAGQLTIGNGSINGKISGTSEIVFNSGSLLLNRTSNANIDAIRDAAAITINGGGTFSVTSSSGGSSANETIGAVANNAGQMNFVQTANNQNTLTLTSLGRGPNADAAFTFSSPAFTTAAFAVNGASATAGNEIIGPWATVGTAANAQADYAIYNGSSQIVARNIAASAQSTWSTAHALDSNYTLTLAAGTATQLTSTRSINSLRNIAGTAQNITSIVANVITVTGSAYANGDAVVTGGTVPTGLAKETVYYVVNASGTTFQLAATPGGSAITGLGTAAGTLTGGIRLSSGNNLETYGILNGSSTYLGIGGATGAGVLTTPTGGGNLYLTTGSGSIVINAPITDNGGPVRVVRNGTGGCLYLSGNNTFTGGLVVNGGVAGSALQLSGTQSFTGGITLTGGAIGENSANGTPYTLAAALNGNAITVNGSSALVVEGTLPSTSTITINPNAVLKLGAGNSTITVQGVVSGSGVLDVNAHNFNSNYPVYLTNTANTFTGDVTYNASNGANTLSVSSIGDGGKVVVGLAVNTATKTFELNSGAIAALTFNTRQFELAGPSGGHNLVIDNNSAQAFTINTDLLATGTGARTLTLQGAGAGLSTFAGKISDGPGMVVSLTKAEAGTWTLSGTNTYTGTTIVSGGKLILSNAWSVASGILDVRGNGTVKVQLDYTGVRPVAEFWTNGVKAASGIMYNSVNAPNHISGPGSIMVGVETFKVTYNGNGHTGGVVPVDSNSYINNQTVVVAEPGSLTKANSSFGGWFVLAGPSYAPGSTFQITNNTTLYATWMPAGTLIQLK